MESFDRLDQHGHVWSSLAQAPAGQCRLALVALQCEAFSPHTELSRAVASDPPSRCHPCLLPRQARGHLALALCLRPAGGTAGLGAHQHAIRGRSLRSSAAARRRYRGGRWSLQPCQATARCCCRPRLLSGALQCGAFAALRAFCSGLDTGASPRCARLGAPLPPGLYERRAMVVEQQDCLPVRLIALVLPQEQAEALRRQKQRQARDKGRKLSEEALFLAGFVLLVTTLPAQAWSKEQLLEL